MLETGSPVVALAEAITTRDAPRVASLLAPDVVLSIPPLHYLSTGAPDVALGLTGLFTAFAELRYEVRSRYLSPGTVTDEAVLTGRQTGAFLGASPGRRPVVVPARLIVDHDGRVVTRLTVWPDVAALRAAVSGVDQIIDLTHASDAGSMITALRATIPPRQPRLIVAGARHGQAPAAAIPATAEADADPEVVLHRTVPRAPVPKTVRQRRTLLAGGSMLLAAGALAAWVAVGVTNLGAVPGRDGGTAAGARATGAAGLAAGPRTGGTDASGRDGRPGDAAGDVNGAGDAAGDAAGAGAGDAAGAGPGTTGGSPAGRDGTPDGGTHDATPDDATAAGTAPDRQLAAGRDTVIIASDLLFATNSAKLTPKAVRILDLLIRQARLQYRSGVVVVTGYTDGDGTSAYNLRLSKQRAAAVAKKLRKGLAGTDMTVRAVGLGEAHPVAEDTTEKGKQANRRVTVMFPPVSRRPDDAGA